MPDVTAEATFAGFLPWLVDNRAAVLALLPSRWGTLALTAGCDDRAPRADVLPLRSGELARILSPEVDSDSLTWNTILFDAASALSEQLVGPLRERLDAISRPRCATPSRSGGPSVAFRATRDGMHVPMRREHRRRADPHGDPTGNRECDSRVSGCRDPD